MPCRKKISALEERLRPPIDMPKLSISCKAALFPRATALENAVAYVRFTTRTTAVSAYGQRACAARRANRQCGAGESTYEVNYNFEAG